MKMEARLKVEDEKKRGGTTAFWLRFEGSVGDKKNSSGGKRGGRLGRDGF